MNRKKLSYYKSSNGLLVIGVLGYVALSLYFYQKDFIFNSNNATISFVITILFLIAAGWLGYLIHRLSLEEKAVAMAMRSEIKSIPDVELIATELPPSWIRDKIHRIIKIARAKGSINTTTLSRLLENEVRTSGNIVKYIAGVVVLIGLLGTFLGLIQAVKGLQTALNQQTYVSVLSNPRDVGTSQDDIESLYANMTGTLGGLDKAFGTSVAGIIASIILGLLYIGFKNAERGVINQLEVVASVEILPYYQRVENDSIAMIVAESVNRALPKVVKQAADDLKKSTENLEDATKAIKSGQSALTGIIQSMGAETTRLVSENEKLTLWLQKFSATVNLIKDGQDAVTNGIELLKEYVTKKETGFLSTTAEMKNTLQQTHHTFRDVGTYIKNKDERIESIAQQTSDSFAGIEKIFGLLNGTLEKMGSNLTQNQTEFSRLSAANRNTLNQLSNVFLNLEKSYQSLLEHTSSKDYEFKKILQDSYVTNQRAGEVLDKISSKLEGHRSILQDIIKAINEFSTHQISRVTKPKDENVKTKVQSIKNNSVVKRWTSLFKSKKRNS